MLSDPMILNSIEVEEVELFARFSVRGVGFVRKSLERYIEVQPASIICRNVSAPEVLS